MRQALVKMGYSRLPSLGDESLATIGDTDIPEDVRMNFLRDHLKAKATKRLPGRSEYVNEGQSTGRATGGVLGGLAGGGLASLHSGASPKHLIGAAALGALGGGYVGHRTGGSVGAADYSSDMGRQGHAKRLLADDSRQRQELARKVTQHRQRQLAQQRAHEEEMQRIPQTNVNYNLQNERPYGYY